MRNSRSRNRVKQYVPNDAVPFYGVRLQGAGGARLGWWAVYATGYAVFLGRTADEVEKNAAEQAERHRACQDAEVEATCKCESRLCPVCGGNDDAQEVSYVH